MLLSETFEIVGLERYQTVLNQLGVPKGNNF